MSSDESYDDDELRDARALAEALERGGEPDREIADALDAAEVVAWLRSPLLDEARSEAVLREAERRIDRAKRAQRRLTWIGSAAGALALAAAALLMVRVQREPSPSAGSRAEAPVAQAPAPAPAPAVSALRAAQLAWLSAPSPDAAAALERELAAYRSEQLAVLERRYGR